MGRTKIYAHRGSKGTHPENTLEAFKEAVRLGVDGIELDVHLSKDGKLVIIHDETVDRTTDGSGNVRDMTLDELKSLDAGSWFGWEFQGAAIPTLDEVLELLAGTGIMLNVEIKSDVIPYEGIEQKVLEALERHSYKEQAIISSFNHYSLKKVRKLDPYIETAILFMEVLHEPWAYAKTIGAFGLHVYLPVAYTEMARTATNLGVPVRVFTVNKEKNMRELIQLGVDTIMTDYPERALEIRNGRGGEE
ncbi:glycerophosphodiester phosphodiesterase [Neobacillus piezotolerans]|uniref:Glycerophosphodiester phosphodiesterase n=1 Tax=Neobacillus piezotolerans TaxID=2259171 RepID=A0A3D8GU69_9BACI|nr:glycerophosphodiester phosphodiesterase [Neobacillus piezotolerans]RDU37749.1 glycerophosphodiester phosphodiesterase [Neobacillus piezotolerans]